VRVTRVHDLGDVSGPVTVDCANGMAQRMRLVGPVTLTLVPPPVTAGEPSFRLLFRQDEEGGRTIAWPADVRWPRNWIQPACDEYGNPIGEGRYSSEPIPVDARPRWLSLVVVHVLPIGLCAENPVCFEPSEESR